MNEPAFDREGVVLKFALDPFQIEQTLAVQNLVEHSRRNKFGRRRKERRSNRQVCRAGGWTGGTFERCRGRHGFKFPVDDGPMRYSVDPSRGRIVSIARTFTSR